MRQFIQDMLHMTEGEKLVAYWPLWLAMLVLAIFFLEIGSWIRKKKRKV